jgi:hypothetical protein
LRLSHGVKLKRSDYESTLSNGAHQLTDEPRNIDRSPEDSQSQRRDGGDLSSLAYRQSPGAAYYTSASLVNESVDVCSAFVCHLTRKLTVSLELKLQWWCWQFQNPFIGNHCWHCLETAAGEEKLPSDFAGS